MRLKIAELMFTMRPLISGRPNLVIEDLLMKINEKYRDNRRFTITELSEHFVLISQTLVNEMLVKKLDYYEFCARWVPKTFT